ncbi:hypothetical protein [Cyanobium sp. ATX 6F1]|uniref:hypothetical protein n=1 Tax=Cyanobium sp. ATX 6F1 TaxID=2823702 RepID=UPI0020CDF8ED|nr:hypothetical protein [Cyanobium sp. ATX 6F1]MCP9914934.1 hypothetical protein [Cyanobium sp. ATX 6F1]
MLRRLLLIPLLAPLLAVFLVGALNPRPVLPLRLLVWSAPALPIGIWMALAAGGGALLSGGATALALRSGAPALRRRLRQGPAGAPWEGPTRPRPAAEPERAPGFAAPEVAIPTGGQWPRRAPQDPPPTVSVPFRVIRKGKPAAAAQATVATGPSHGRSAAAADPDVSWDSPEQDDW